MAVSYFDCTCAIGIPTYLTLMSGLAFSNSAMISFQTVGAGPPLLSQNVIVPLPEPSAPWSPAGTMPSSPQAVAVSARRAQSDGGDGRGACSVLPVALVMVGYFLLMKRISWV